MTSLTAIFGSSPEKPEEDSDKLLNLYWNRVELKKEFAELRKERFRLQDRIKQHEGATARVQQKLDHIESLLLDPEWVYSAIIYYQFRSLNMRCKSKLAKFAEKLKQQREEKQHGHLLAEWNDGRAQEVAEVEHRIGQQRIQGQVLEDQLQAARHRLMSMNGFLRIFRGRSIAATIDELSEYIETTRREEENLLRQYDEIQKRQPPETRGLDIQTKRLINYMILAFAQQIYLHYSDNDLVTLAKEAGAKSLGAVRYGGRGECELLLGRIIERTESFENSPDFADDLQLRAKRIADKAVFRIEGDAVPVSASITTLYIVGEDGVVKEEDADLLGENYWDLAKILSR